MNRDDLTSVFGGLDSIDLNYLMQQAGEAIVFVDAGWTVRFCNQVYLANVGLPKHEVIGRTPFEYLPNFKRSIFYTTIESCRRERKPVAKIGYSTALDRWLMVRVFPAGDGMMMLANDASESIVKQAQLAQQVVKDPLTGLPNKLGLISDVESLMDLPDGFSLTVIGLDRFRSVNDSLGFAGGDMALLEVASRLQSATIAGETLYRLSGDEFCILQKQGRELTQDRTAALMSAACQPVEIHGRRFVLGASAGSVVRDTESKDPERLLKQASLALRHAKKTRRGELVLYEPGLERNSELRAQLESELRSAIDLKQLLLVLQPKGCLSRGGLVGAEALIRWAHPKRGLVSPAEFLPLAADAGLMGVIDQMVLQQAIRHSTELRSLGVAVPISINLSVSSLSDVCMVDRIRESLHEAKLPPQMLEIEIPEDALMQNVEASAKVLSGLNAMGVRISIDDFGTGYSSFAYLARFPVHALKVDRSFVKEIATSETSRKIVTGMVRLAHSLQMQVIGEGAEGTTEIDLLRKMRCDVVQGYGYGKPMSISKFVEFARQQRLASTGEISDLTI